MKEPGARCQGASTAEIVSAIEGDIIVGRLMPRERLIEEDLMMRFGATRHIIRQALGELERMHIVEHIPHRGALVRAYSAEELRALYELRAVLETHAVTLIAMPGRPADIAGLEAIQGRYEAAIARDDMITVYRENRAFHRALFDLSGNQFLTDAIMDSASRTHSLRHQWLAQPHFLEQARRQHRAMIAAIRKGDRDLLQALLREHVAAAREFFTRYTSRCGGGGAPA